MKNTINILKYAAVAAIVSTAFSCTREEIEAPSGEKFTLEVSLTPQAKTTLGESDGTGFRKVYWSDGDQIAANGKVSEALENLSAETQSTIFTFSEQNNPGAAPYNVLYPASAYVDATHINLPSLQTYKTGSFADGMNPMAGVSDGSSLTLSHLCAVLHISVKRSADSAADTDNLLAVRFKGKAGEQVCGSFSIDYANAALTGNSSADADKEVRVVKSRATSVDTPVEYYLVVPAGTYASGFELTVQDESNHIMTKSKNVSTSLVAGKVYNMAEFDFVPSGTDTGIEIASAEELIAFAKAYNNKEYEALGASLVATVVQNITFDANSSAAFNATGGIGLKNNIHGSEDYYFNGSFNGNGKTISGLSATVPLFTATGGTGRVYDLTVDNSSFLFTHQNTTQGQFGAIVGYHKGLLQNVVVAADMALAAADVSYETCFGGIVGRIVEGTLDNCSFEGAISVPEDFSVTNKLTYIGGLAGSITNAAGVITESAFNGTIDNQGKVSCSDSTAPYLIIGGIVGRNNGTVSNCTTSNHATGVTVTLTDDSDHDYTGTIVTHSTLAYNYSIAGICGDNRATVTDCTNNANILNTFSSGRGSNDVNGRYLHIGGIVGFNNAEGAGVFNCDNNGAIIDRANPKMHYVGGIVGRNYKGMVASCDNNTGANIGVGTSHASPYSVRQLKLGGVIGWNDGTGSVKNVHNAANLNVSRLESSTAVFSYIGGVVGQSSAEIDGSADGGSITNSGTIAQTNGIGMIAAPTATLDQGIFLGGVVAHTTQAVKNVSNSGKITYTCTAAGVGAQYVQMGGVVGKVNASSAVDVEYCTNTADVTFVVSTAEKTNATVAANKATRYYYNYLGGIVGYANNVNIKGDASSKCTNSGIIKGGDGSANNNQATPSFMIGGIAGYITGDSSVSYCALTGTGQSYNDHWSNRGITNYDTPCVGGIVGQVVGADGALVPISNCEIAGTASVNTRRGAAGGIIGLAQYATISDCTMPVIFQSSQSGYFYGGIVGSAQNSTISNCSFSGTTIRSTQLQIAGGIVGKLDTGSSIDGCTSSATDVSKNGTAVATTGGIAGSSVAGATIQNCHYTAAIGKICGDSNFTDGGGNAADL